MSCPSLLRESLPVFVEPMLASAGQPRAGAEASWAVEVKFDGIRTQLRVDHDRGWCVRSRPGRNCSSQFPEVAEAAAGLAEHQVVLDGELVHFGADGRPDFAALRRRLTAPDAAAAARLSAHAPATFVVFDVLHLDGHATRSLPYAQRRALLHQLAADAQGWLLAPSWTQRLEDVVEVTRAHELEGVVFKRLDSIYRPGRRTTAWRKLKHRRQETLTVTAWTPGNRQPDAFHLARRDRDGELIFAGSAQLGLTRDQREALRARIRELETPTTGRGRVRPVAAGVSLVVSGHGPAGTPLRDAVVREILLDR